MDLQKDNQSINAKGGKCVEINILMRRSFYNIEMKSSQSAFKRQSGPRKITFFGLNI